VAKTKVLLQTKDVAHLLDCSPDDIAQFVRTGKLRGTKDGRYWRFRLADVMTYKKEREKSE